MDLQSQLDNHYSKIIEIIQNSYKFDELPFTELISSIKFLRNSCSKGSEVQIHISSYPEILTILQYAFKSTICSNLTENENCDFKILLWQLMANIIVNNKTTQGIIWSAFKQNILDSLSELTPFTDIQLMILYNFKLSSSQFIDSNEIFLILTKIWKNVLEKQDNTIKLEFLHIFFEDLLCKTPRIIALYGPQPPELRIPVLKYLQSYIRNGSPNGKINRSLLEFISKEFKKKSDFILSNKLNGSFHAEEIMEMLDVISVATGDDVYSEIYVEDHSLFLNAGGLVETLNDLGQKSQNIFTPMEKLTEVAPNSNISSDFEKEMSFQLRTKLVRVLANLLYKNKKNQEYAREMNVIVAILNCTRSDARNPMLKEWSILAIRNLCENCPENQMFIANLSKVGEAPNNVLTELNLEMGALRIKPNE